MTDGVARRNLTTGAKVFLVIAMVLGAINLVDFLFYGKKITDLVIAIGFTLMAYGTYKNGNRSRPDSTDDSTFDKNAQYATVAGVILVAAAVLANYLL
jgi:hypothetical protein